MQINIDRVVEDLPVTHNAAHRMEDALTVLLGVAANFSVLPNMDTRISTLYEEVIPAVRAL